MTSNHKIPNQVKQSPETSWLQIIKFLIKSSTSVRWDDLKSQNSQSSQALPQDEMTWNHKISNQVKYFRKMRWLEITKFPIKSSTSARWDDLKSQNSQSSQALPKDKLTLIYKIPNQVIYSPKTPIPSNTHPPKRLQFLQDTRGNAKWCVWLIDLSKRRNITILINNIYLLY